MPTLSRMLPAALALFLATSLAVTVDGAATASPVIAGTTAPAHARTGAGALDLGADAVLPRRDGRTAKVQRWNVRTLWYYETLPAKWDWSLSTAVAKWNASGGRIKLARTVLPRKAQVRIGYAKIGGAAGQATVGATRNAYVRLSSRFGTMDAVNAHNRVTIMSVLAHELGHVLGFQHTSARCSLMAPVLDVDACDVVPTSEPGFYKCRTIDVLLVQRFIRMYGGSAYYPNATWCLIDPFPPALSGVTFTGGTSDPVTVHWKPPTSVPAGTTMVLKRWESSTCGAAPTSAATFRPSVASGVWHDQVATDDEVACFQLQLFNRLGAARAAKKQVRSRWVPVPVLGVPELGTPSYDFDAEQFTFPATVPAGTTLHAVWDRYHPDTCLPTPTGQSNGTVVPVVDGRGVLESPAALPQCVSFFAYEPERNRFSAPAFLTFTEPDWPTPDAPVVGTPAYDRATGKFTVPVSVPDGTQLSAMWNATSPSSCVTEAGSGNPQTFTRVDGVVSITATGTFPRCISFFAFDGHHDRRSAATPTTFTIPEPDGVDLTVPDGG